MGKQAPKSPLSEKESAFVRSLVLHEDAEIIALDKPAGLSSQGGRIAAKTLDDFLVAFAKPSGVRPRLVHRLDRDTSGVILTARSQPSAAYLGKAFMTRRVRKTYLAIVAPGAPNPPAGSIDTPLVRASVGRDVHMIPAARGDVAAQEAFTGYRTLASNDVAALVVLSPRTGRMHQLRVHLASIGHPIAGDVRYGGALVLAGRPVPRLMLHAFELTFPHPSGGERAIKACLPQDMLEVLRAAAIEPNTTMMKQLTEY